MALVNGAEAPDLEAAVRQALGGQPDAVIEATGNPVAYNTAIHMVRPGGKICAVSITGKAQIEADLDYLVTRDITMIGMLASPNSFEPALRMIGAGKIDVLSCVTHTFPFLETKEACDFVRDRSVTDRIKVIITHED
jgi:threonine dehydrogenase-like Zn-dependent dehydrogenase